MIKVIFRTLNVGIILALLAFNFLTLTSSAIHNAAYQLIDKLPMPHLRDNSPTAEKNRLSRKIQAIEKHNAKLKSNTKRLTNKIAKRTAKSAARSLSSVALEAVPYAGIAVLAASLGLDLKDACDTMKDIDDLEMSLDIHSQSTTSATDTEKVCGFSVPSATELSIQMKQFIQTTGEEYWDFGGFIFDYWTKQLQ